LHHATDVLRDGTQQIAKFQIGDNLIGDVKKKLQPVVLTPQFLRLPAQGREIQGVVECQRNISRRFGDELDFAWRVSIDLLATKSDCPQFAVRGRQWQCADGANIGFLNNACSRL
jgi:hypothetical protein